MYTNKRTVAIIFQRVPRAPITNLYRCGRLLLLLLLMRNHEVRKSFGHFCRASGGDIDKRDTLPPAKRWTPHCCFCERRRETSTQTKRVPSDGPTRNSRSSAIDEDATAVVVNNIKIPHCRTFGSRNGFFSFVFACVRCFFFRVCVVIGSSSEFPIFMFYCWRIGSWISVVLSMRRIFWDYDAPNSVPQRSKRMRF